MLELVGRLDLQVPPLDEDVVRGVSRRLVVELDQDRGAAAAAMGSTLTSTRDFEVGPLSQPVTSSQGAPTMH
jgi:hypothetical protein